jgi:23S rRNA pseudouridine1911/1915/1917 synthase
MKEISNKNNLQVLHEDNHIIVVNKRVGDIVQGDKTGDKPLSEVVKEYIRQIQQTRRSFSWCSA